MTQTPAEAAFSLLNKQQFINLVTLRKNGETVRTPMWFAEKNGRIYMMTPQDSGKIKRIRNNPNVQVGPADRAGKPLGTTLAGKARILTDPQEILVAKYALDDKYGLFKAILDFFATVFMDIQRAWVEITPVE
ncbi:MAG: PPOX class F420-dependent oxidoreductase [Candidatus Viridilinea halotolerans]|uniref:PPOX class F420-dependent oxidoreductase n=1 Tax=Candidatus Viridilinea halotolerans TaxID=2491704 RepID=A0A426TXU0_9CHLR|nr:MAG: PPOX class F420-dependent oxidoreductase [Candidatus Viridilinea halotolerans]